MKIAESYQGITGNTALNQFGDRKYGDYDFWAVRNSEGTHDSFIWKHTGKYVPNKNRTTAYPPDHAGKVR